MKNYILKKLKYKNFRLIRIKKFNEQKLNILIKKLFIYFTGHNLIRIGNSNGDGGYLVPDIINDIEYCFSPGVGRQTGFEDELLCKYNIKSFLLDGTVDYKGNHHFIKKNLDNYNSQNTITIERWLSKFPEIKNNNNLLLQMDIENNEVEVLLNTDLDVLKKFKIIIIEFHNFDDLYSDLVMNLYIKIFTKLLNNFTICHIHPNNNGGQNFYNNIGLPSLLEITLINNEEVKIKKKIDYELPHYLDKKNNTEIKDLILPKFFYQERTIL
jgi:hypothetical protein